MTRLVIVTAYDGTGKKLGHTEVEVLRATGPRSGTPEQATSNGLSALISAFSDKIARHSVEYVE